MPYSDRYTESATIEVLIKRQCTSSLTFDQYHFSTDGERYLYQWSICGLHGRRTSRRKDFHREYLDAVRSRRRAMIVMILSNAFSIAYLIGSSAVDSTLSARLLPRTALLCTQF